MENSNKRTVLVTGATGGLGTAMCKKLFNDGYTVVGNYHTKEKADKWTEQMKKDGFTIELFFGDVSDYESSGKMIAEINAKYGITLVSHAMDV